MNCLTIAICCMTIASENCKTEFPKPTGDFSAAHQSIELIDNSRKDPYNPQEFRKLKITIYYPTQKNDKKEPYGTEETMFWTRELEEALNENALTQQELTSIVQEFNCTKVSKSLNAQPVPGSFPVILFEHGFGVTAGSYQQIILELVSHGYVVLSPAHPYIADLVIFEDETKALLKAERNALVFETYFQDTQFILQKIKEIAAKIPSMNYNKIGMIGHSLGGAITIRTTRGNPLIQAGIALDAPITHDVYDYDDGKRIPSKLDSEIILDSGSNMGKPFLYIFAEQYLSNPATVQVGNNGSKEIIKGTEHNSFADHNFFKENISVFKEKKWHLGAGNAVSASYQPKLMFSILEFFDKFLKIN